MPLKKKADHVPEIDALEVINPKDTTHFVNKCIVSFVEEVEINNDKWDKLCLPLLRENKAEYI